MNSSTPAGWQLNFLDDGLCGNFGEASIAVNEN
jgi:hypothetical protein